MFIRLAITSNQGNTGGRIIHTDPPKNPPRYDLRKPSLLPDPDLDRDLDTHDPDLDLPEV